MVGMSIGAASVEQHGSSLKKQKQSYHMIQQVSQVALVVKTCLPMQET